MATGTAIALGISAATAAASTGMAIHQAQTGRERQRKAEEALDSYERQDLKNVYANLRVPMEGYRMREQEIQQQTANQAEMLSMAGARGMTGTTALMMQSQMGMAAIQADLEQSQFRVKQMIASEEARIQGMQERREEQDLAGLGAERVAGSQQFQTGVAGAIKGVGALGSSLMGIGGGLGRERIDVPQSMSPIQTNQVTVTGGPGSQDYIDPNQFRPK